MTSQVYNLGDYRRKIQPKYAGNDIFSPDNKEGNALRERVCNEGLADLLHWLEHEEGEVGDLTLGKSLFCANPVELLKFSLIIPGGCF